MELESKIFQRMRVDRGRLAEYGFEKTENEMCLERELLGGDFVAEISVDADGRLKGKVIDVMDGEEFVQLRNESYNGSFVNSVRSEYEDLLRDIAEKCFDEVTFAADQSNRIAALVLEKYGVEPDFPWDKDPYTSAGVFRHKDNSKWFGLVMTIRYGNLKKPGYKSETPKAAVDALNLKINPEDAEALHARDGIFPAYHMSHKNWISVTLDDTLTDEAVMALIAESFDLTETKKKAGSMDEAFIRKVLEVADSVPQGKVVSYGQIADLVGRSKNARMVGKIMSMADRYGDHPCHRVVNSSGRTVPGWTEQRAMLEAEGIEFKSNGCVDMEKCRWGTK